MDKDKIYNKFKPNVYMKPDAYLNGWARKCGWKATIVYDSLWRHANIEGRCFPSYKLMAEEHGVSESTIKRGVNILLSYRILEKRQKRSRTGKFLYNEYILNDKSKWLEEPETVGLTRPTVNRRSVQTPTVGLTRPHKDTHIKDTHTPLYIPPLKKYSSLKDIKEDDLQEIATQYRVPLAFVKLQLEKMTNWLEAKGKRYKNYKRALMNWVLSEAQKQVERRQGDATKRGVDASYLG